MKTSLFKMIGVFALVLGAFSMPHETAARSSQRAPEYTPGGMTFFGPTPAHSGGSVVLRNCPRHKVC